MEWLVENWFVVVTGLAVLVAIGVAIYKFAGLPTQEQVKKIKKWLLFAVIESEKALGSKTGELKLRTVYNMFITKFPVIARLVSFETFSSWVDEALAEMKELLEKNSSIKALVKNGTVASK